jgi:hypothetical protein
MLGSDQCTVSRILSYWLSLFTATATKKQVLRIEYEVFEFNVQSSMFKVQKRVETLNLEH